MLPFPEDDRWDNIRTREGEWKSSCKHFICGFLPERFPRFLIRIPQIYYTWLVHSKSLTMISYHERAHYTTIPPLFFLPSFRCKRYNQASVMAPRNIMSAFDAAIFVYERERKKSGQLTDSCVPVFLSFFKSSPTVSHSLQTKLFTHIHKNTRINTIFFFHLIFFALA